MKQSATISIFAVLLLFLFSCTKKMTFNNSSVIPAARGSVQVKSDKNNNSNIKLHVTHMADPSRLTPPRKVYVVWMQTENDGTKNIGQLRSSSSMLSKTIKGSLTTVTSFKPVSFMVTAEDDPSVQYPGSTVVLSTSN